MWTDVEVEETMSSIRARIDEIEALNAELKKRNTHLENLLWEHEND